MGVCRRVKTWPAVTAQLVLASELKLKGRQLLGDGGLLVQASLHPARARAMAIWPLTLMRGEL